MFRNLLPRCANKFRYEIHINLQFPLLIFYICLKVSLVIEVERVHDTIMYIIFYNWWCSARILHWICCNKIELQTHIRIANLIKYNWCQFCVPVISNGFLLNITKSTWFFSSVEISGKRKCIVILFQLKHYFVKLIGLIFDTCRILCSDKQFIMTSLSVT